MVVVNEDDAHNEEVLAAHPLVTVPEHIQKTVFYYIFRLLCSSEQYMYRMISSSHDPMNEGRDRDRDREEQGPRRIHLVYEYRRVHPEEEEEAPAASITDQAIPSISSPHIHLTCHPS